MGAIRSAYSCPVFWRQGQETPDVMHWYFADPCAGKFPFRHRFQTAYQYSESSEQTTIGEQPGPRPYSKGFGPIGAPHQGLVWQGALDSFVNGVPASALPVAPLHCPPTLVGNYPFPPPSTWTGPTFLVTYHGPEWSGLEGANAGGFLDWYFLVLGIDPLDPDSIIVVRWHFVEGYGMLLYYGYSYSPYHDNPVYDTEFIDVIETTTTVTWRYLYLDSVGGEHVFYVTMTKCFP